MGAPPGRRTAPFPPGGAPRPSRTPRARGPGHSPALSRMTWSSRGSSEKCGTRLAHSTRVKSCLSAAWQMLVTGSLGWGQGAPQLAPRPPDPSPEGLNHAPKDTHVPDPTKVPLSTATEAADVTESRVLRREVTPGGAPSAITRGASLQGGRSSEPVEERRLLAVRLETRLRPGEPACRGPDSPGDADQTCGLGRREASALCCSRHPVWGHFSQQPQSLGGDRQTGCTESQAGLGGSQLRPPGLGWRHL